MTPTTYKLKCLSRCLRNSTVGWLWSWRLAVRLARGRWYVFHDAPWWARVESNLRLRRGRLEP